MSPKKFVYRHWYHESEAEADEQTTKDYGPSDKPPLLPVASTQARCLLQYLARGNIATNYLRLNLNECVVEVAVAPAGVTGVGTTAAEDV